MKAQAGTIVKSFFGPKADTVLQEYAISTAPEPFTPCTTCFTDFLFAMGLSNAPGLAFETWGYRSDFPGAFNFPLNMACHLDYCVLAQGAKKLNMSRISWVASAA